VTASNTLWAQLLSLQASGSSFTLTDDLGWSGTVRIVTLTPERRRGQASWSSDPVRRYTCEVVIVG